MNDVRKPDHVHIFQWPHSGMGEMFDMITGRGEMERIFCYRDDCYADLDPKRYPAELIGPKLVIK